MEPAKVPHVKKAKKKQVKDELDRIKQAEKKRRRLEKALANSAAIRSELEKKKQKKKEEQQRLDDEGAAIAEAVALHVLLEEDSDETPAIVLKNAEEFNDWRHGSNIGLFVNGPTFAHQNSKIRSFGTIGWFPSAHGHGFDSNNFVESNRPFSSWAVEKNFGFPCIHDGEYGPYDISDAHIAAQAVSSLQIGEDSRVGEVFFNRY